MKVAQHLTKHLRELHYGGNWTAVNLQDALKDVTWQQATTQVGNLNTIARLVFHVNYYVRAILRVLEGNPLDASDKFSFDVPPIESAQDWEELKQASWASVDKLANLVEGMQDDMLWEDFGDGKYGNIYRNLQGLIEHSHYHLGQISLIKKMPENRKTGKVLQAIFANCQSERSEDPYRVKRAPGLQLPTTIYSTLDTTSHLAHKERNQRNKWTS